MIRKRRRSNWACSESVTHRRGEKQENRTYLKDKDQAASRASTGDNPHGSNMIAGGCGIRKRRLPQARACSLPCRAWCACGV